MATPLLGPKLDFVGASHAPAFDVKPIAESAHSAFNAVSNWFSHAADGPSKVTRGAEVERATESETAATTTAISDVEPPSDKKGLHRLRKLLPDYLETEGGHRYSVKDFFQKWQLVKEYWLQKKQQGQPSNQSLSQENIDAATKEAMVVMADKLPNLRPSKDHALGDRIDVPKLIQKLEAFASAYDFAQAKRVMSRYRAQGSVPMEKLRAIAGDERFIEMDVLEDAVLSELLRAKEKDFYPKMEGLRERMAQLLGISPERDQVVTLQTEDNQRVIPVSFDVLFQDVVREHGRKLLTSPNIPVSTLEKLESAAKASGLSGPPAMPIHELDAKRLEDAVASGKKIEIGRFDFVQPAEEYLRSIEEEHRRQGRSVNLPSGATITGVSPEDIAYEFLQDMAAHHDATRRVLASHFHLNGVDGRPGEFLTRGQVDSVLNENGFSPVSGQRAYHFALRNLRNKTRFVRLHDTAGNALGLLQTADWLRIFGLPRTNPQLNAISRALEVDSNTVASIKKPGGREIALNAGLALELKNFVHSNASSADPVKSILSYSKMPKPDEPDILGALRTLQVRQPGDELVLKMGNDSLRTPFKSLIQYILDGHPFPGLDLAALESYSPAKRPAPKRSPIASRELEVQSR